MTMNLRLARETKIYQELAKAGVDLLQDMKRASHKEICHQAQQIGMADVIVWDLVEAMILEELNGGQHSGSNGSDVPPDSEWRAYIYKVTEAYFEARSKGEWPPEDDTDLMPYLPFGHAKRGAGWIMEAPEHEGILGVWLKLRQRVTLGTMVTHVRRVRSAASKHALPNGSALAIEDLSHGL
jgi:hypothetical protein